MFANEMIEKKDCVIKIEDFTYKTIETLVRYLYAFKITDSIDEELLQAADKYQMEDLKVCVSF
jgi:hypothetical protein